MISCFIFMGPWCLFYQALFWLIFWLLVPFLLMVNPKRQKLSITSICSLSVLRLILIPVVISWSLQLIFILNLKHVNNIVYRNEWYQFFFFPCSLNPDSPTPTHQLGTCQEKLKVRHFRSFFSPSWELKQEPSPRALIKSEENSYWLYG